MSHNTYGEKVKSLLTYGMADESDICGKRQEALKDVEEKVKKEIDYRKWQSNYDEVI